MESQQRTLYTEIQITGPQNSYKWSYISRRSDRRVASSLQNYAVYCGVIRFPTDDVRAQHPANRATGIMKNPRILITVFTQPVFKTNLAFNEFYIQSVHLQIYTYAAK